MCAAAVMYIAIFHSQPRGDPHGLQSYRFVKLPSSPRSNTFVQAFANFDWCVVASISTFALLNIVILVSTGLLAAQQVIMHKQHEPISLIWNPVELRFNGTFYPTPVDTYWGTSG